jgi:hypothetical protein
MKRNDPKLVSIESFAAVWRPRSAEIKVFDGCNPMLRLLEMALRALIPRLDYRSVISTLWEALKEGIRAIIKSNPLDG